MQQTTKHGLKILFVCLTLITIMFGIRKKQEDRIRRNGVFQVGIVFKKEHAKNGTRYHFKYAYNGTIYSAKYLDSGVDSLFLIKLLPDNPKLWMVIYDKLPPCLKRANYPDTGWQELPECN